MLPDPAPPAFGEKRRCSRARRFRQARCAFLDGTSVLDVTLRDISAAGARIEGDELICLPETFDLQILDGFGGYAARRARLVWRRGDSAGVKFID